MEEKDWDDQTNTDIFADDFSADRAKNSKATAKRFIGELLTQKWKLLAVLLCLTASAVCSMISPLLIGKAIDQIVDGIRNAAASGSTFTADYRTMGTVMSALLIVYLLGSLFNYFPQYILASISQNLALDMRKRISDKLNRLPLKYFDSHKKGDILSRVTNDMERIADTLQEALTQMFTAVITVVGSFIMMFMLSPSLTLIAFATIVVSIVVAALISIKTKSFYSENQAALGALNANIEEAFTGDAVIKAFNLQDNMIAANDELSEALRKAGTKAQFITYGVEPAIRLIGHIGYVAIAVRGAMAVIRGTISIGDIQAVFQYVNQISEPAAQLAYTINSLQGAIASAERVYELLDEEEETEDAAIMAAEENGNAAAETDAAAAEPGVPSKPAAGVLIPHPEGNVTFEHVKFGYGDSLLMEDINIDVKAGSEIAIVGPTGAGKTTLVNLLMRFYELKGGRITIDGEDISKISRHELRTILGMVLQDTWLFHGTVAENIAYGRSDATAAEIREAASAARVDFFVRTLPQGYDTVLDDELVGISAGQKQLLTIARAFLADPAILILDEATSSVDTRTEAEIQKAMAKLMKGRTSFIIAHRLSTIRDADMILVMNEGTIIEQGTHRELLEMNGFYADLYRSQFAVTAAS